MQWYYGIGNDVVGPVENNGLVQLVQAGVVRAETPVWASYLGNWTPAGRIDGLFAAAGVVFHGGIVAAGGGVGAGRMVEAGVGSGGGSDLYAGAVAGMAGVGGAPVPRIETSSLGLKAAPTQGGVGVPWAGKSGAAVALGQGETGRGGISSGGGGAEDDLLMLKPARRAGKAATSGLLPGRKAGGSAGTNWKKWVVGLGGAVLLAGGGALADKYVFGGKVFGFGAAATGPYRYYPDAPRIVVNFEVRGLLLNPVVAGKLEAGGAMNMIDQMMHAAVGLRPYDIEDVKLVATDVTGGDPRFVCMVTTSKKIPEEQLVEKLFGEENPRKMGGRNVYRLPMVVRGNLLACVADETTFLLGEKEVMEAVLGRTEDPEFSEAELGMVEATAGSKAVLSVGLDGEVLGQLEDMRELLPVSEAALQGSTHSKEIMRSAKSVAMSVDLTEALEIQYRVTFESEQVAEAAEEAMKRDIEEAGEAAERTGKMVPGGKGSQVVDAKAMVEIMKGVKVAREGAVVVVLMGIPMDVFEEVVGQSIGAAGP